MATTARAHTIPFALRSELVEAAANHGYRGVRGEAMGWLFFASEENVPGEIALAVAGDGSAWFLAVEHRGVAARLEALRAEPPPGPDGKFAAAYGFAVQGDMRRAISRCYQLAASLPTLPLAEYVAETKHLGDTEADRIVKQRIGQDVFRKALDKYWEGRCAVTGISQRELLRASHIVPWAECRSDAERLDAENGLLLAAHWDAAFDAGLVSFDEEGRALAGPGLGAEARAMLGVETARLLRTNDRLREQLAWHRQRFGF